MPSLTFADVSEAVRAAIASYTHALDEGRVEDVVNTFCPDGVFELIGRGASEGHEVLRKTYGKWTPVVPQRHMVLNTLITDWSDTEARAVSDVVLLTEGESGWTVSFVAKYNDHLLNVDGVWKFKRREVS